MLTIAETLNYANVQMAAEALYGFDANVTPGMEPGQKFTYPIDPAILTTGNRHASPNQRGQRHLAFRTANYMNR